MTTRHELFQWVAEFFGDEDYKLRLEFAMVYDPDLKNYSLNDKIVLIKKYVETNPTCLDKNKVENFSFDPDYEESIYQKHFNWVNGIDDEKQLENEEAMKTIFDMMEQGHVFTDGELIRIWERK